MEEGAMSSSLILVGFLPSHARLAWVYFGKYMMSECQKCWETILDVEASWRHS